MPYSPQDLGPQQVSSAPWSPGHLSTSPSLLPTTPGSSRSLSPAPPIGSPPCRHQPPKHNSRPGQTPGAWPLRPADRPRPPAGFQGQLPRRAQSMSDNPVPPAWAWNLLLLLCNPTSNLRGHPGSGPALWPSPEAAPSLRCLRCPCPWSNTHVRTHTLTHTLHSRPGVGTSVPTCVLPQSTPLSGPAGLSPARQQPILPIPKSAAGRTAPPAPS